MLYVGGMTNGEEFFDSNGEFAGEKFPVVFWKNNFKTFTWQTTVQKDTSGSVTLLDKFRDWEKSRKN